MIKFVRKRENSKKLYSFAKECQKYIRELNSEEQEQLNHEQAPSKATKRINQKAKSNGLKNLESS